jgi:Tfp pilus assembly protein PilF
MTRRARLIASAIVLAEIVFFCGTATAQKSHAREWCENADGISIDLRISGCTTWIRSGQLSGHDLASVFFNRGYAYLAKGQQDLAIKDFDQVIGIDPTKAAAISGRGQSHAMAGQDDIALEDFSRAIKLDPNNVRAYVGRGTSYSLTDHFDLALNDFDRAIKLNPAIATFIKEVRDLTIADLAL